MLPLLRSMLAVAVLRVEYTDGARPDENGRRFGWCTGDVMVDRLLVRLGTSSTENLTSGPGSPSENGR